MSIINDSLSALKPGTVVKLTQSSGYSVYGVVTANDGSESLSLSVTTVATLRYDQISAMEVASTVGNVQLPLPAPVEASPVPAPAPVTNVTVPQPVNVPAEKPASAEVKVAEVVCSAATANNAFKALSSAEKKSLNPAVNKLTDGIKKHDTSKIREAFNFAVKVCNDNKSFNNPRVSEYIANIALLAGDSTNAADYFFAAGHDVKAYRIAFAAARKEDSRKLYLSAAAYAAIYIASDSELADGEEAAYVLKTASLMCNDVGGVKFASYAVSEAKAHSLLIKILHELCDGTGVTLNDMSDISGCCDKLQKFYPITDINTECEFRISSRKSEPVNEEQPEEDTADEFADDTSTISPDTEYTGMMTSFKLSEKNGAIEMDNGERCLFDLADVTDQSLYDRLSKTTKLLAKIHVKFKVTKMYGQNYAINIKNSYHPGDNSSGDPGSNTIKVSSATSADELFSSREYDKAIVLYKELINGTDYEHGIIGVINCYLAMQNMGGETDYTGELNAFINKYASKLSKNTKNMEVLQQYYMKFQRYRECLDAVNVLLDLCDSEDYNRIIHYLAIKARCYKSLGDYSSAASNYQEWVNIVNKYQLNKFYDIRENHIYIELAELYYELDDMEKAKKYFNLAGASERKKELSEKLDPAENPQQEQEEEDYADEADENTVPLQELYDAYTDDGGFESLQMTDKDIAGAVTSFGCDKLHCVLAYLSAAARIADRIPASRASVITPEITMRDSVKAIEGAFSYAFNSPLSGRDVSSSEIAAVFQQTRKLIPNESDELFAAAAIRALFNNSSVPDYELSDLVLYLKSDELSDLREAYPAITDLADKLYSFHESTGYGIDIFADYRTNASNLEKAIAEARDCCEFLDTRTGSYESQGQVRRMRDYIFTSGEAILRKCLNIAAENETSQFSYVKDTICENFIKNGKTPDTENIDPKKIDRFIDQNWLKARDVILSEGRHVSRPYDNLKGGKRTTTINNIKRMLGCICAWISAAEHSSGNNNDYARNTYYEVVPDIIMYMDLLIRSASNVSENSWGNQAILATANELSQKLSGTYSPKDRQYMFIDFLRSDEVLLDDEFLPELQSTFCGMQDFNILRRIENSASCEPASFQDRLNEIFSDNITKNNMRSARLIKEYADDIGDDEISDSSVLNYLDKCLRDAKHRADTRYEDFRSQLEYDLQNGKISDKNGEKSAILSCVTAWYRICRATGDLGFFARLVEIFENNIADIAEEKADRMKYQLEELAANTDYDFGVYPKEKILEFINDGNFATAEHMMNCIRRNDTKAVEDYTLEPFSYLSCFIDEYANNHRIVADSGMPLESLIIRYSGKKELEKALQRITNNGKKDTRGGVELINSWIFRGNSGGVKGISRLMYALGFVETTITEDENDKNFFFMRRKKRTGKISYPHPIPAFGSATENEDIRIVCLYGRYDCNSLMDKFREVNTAPKHTIVLLDFALNLEERRRLARKIKEEKSFAKSFIVIDRVLLFHLAKHYAANSIIRQLMAITMPFSYYQPFVELSSQPMPPELFTGREEELVAIESSTGVNLVYGGRQLGKSALLKMAQKDVDGNANGDRAVLIEIRELDYKKAAEVVSAKLISAGILSEKCRCDDWDILASHIEKRLMDDSEGHINYLLLLLDEADTFIASCKDVAHRPISALKNLPADRFKVVMAGLHNLSRFNRYMVLHRNSVLVHLGSVVVRPFQRSEAIKLLTNTLAYLGFRFNEDIISFILAKTNYFPGLIQLYCQKLLEAMKNDDYAGYNEINTPYYQVTEEHIKKVLSDPEFTRVVNDKLEMTLFVEEENHSHYHAIALIIAYLLNTEYSENGYTVDEIMAAAGKQKISRIITLKKEQLEEFLQEMWDLNVLTVAIPNSQRYTFATDGFRDMLGNADDVELALAEYMDEEVSS